MIHFDNCEIGKVWPGESFYLVEQDIIDFARQWDPQPFHANKELAKASFYGAITAPSAYLFCISSKLFNNIDSFSGIGGLSHQFDIALPAYAGDTLSFSLKCIEKRASKTKPDRGIVKLELKLSNQNGDAVLIQYSTIMLYREHI